jgi:hypothetical protein
MVPILRRNALLYLGHFMTYSLILTPLLHGDRGVVLAWPLFLPIWLSSTVLWTERDEAYAFLRTLPVTDREIVRLKFGSTLAAAALFALLPSTLTVMVWGGEGPIGPPLALIAVVCCLSLLLAACWHVGFWWAGAAMMTGVILTFMLANLAAAIALIAEYKRTGARSFDTGFALRWLPFESPYLVGLLVAAALGAYYGLMRAGVRIKAASEACL